MSIKIAVSKGRVLESFIDSLTPLGYIFEDLDTRKLVLKEKNNQMEIIIVKALDVPLYVKNGYADLGIVGKDVVDEYDDAFYEIYDLNISCCDLCIAGKKAFDLNAFDELTIATKYPVQGQAYLDQKGQKGQIIKLNGSVELGPMLGISDCILDIVETGNTLKENNLVVKEKVKAISARVIANKIFFKTKNTAIGQLMEQLEKVFGGSDEVSCC